MAFTKNNSLIITNGAMTGALVSSITNLQDAVSYSVQCTWSGTSPVGGFVLQGSNDTVNWASVAPADFAVGANSGSVMYNINAPAYSFARVIYNFTSGTGTANCQICVKA